MKNKGIDFSKGKRIDFSKYKIVSADTDLVKKYKSNIDRLLNLMKHEEAYVTDESRFCDFSLSNSKIRSISKEIGVKFCEDDLLVDVAKKMKE